MSLRFCTPTEALLLALALALSATGAAGAQSFAHPVSLHAGDPDRHMGVRLRGALRLDPVRIDGLKLVELSALAWDDDENLLYALSDQGTLFHLRPEIRDGRLTGLRALSGYPLRNADGEALAGREADAEALDIIGGRNHRRGDTRLLVAFERHHRIDEYRADGRRTGGIALPPALADSRAYASPNKGIESIAMHPVLGLLAAPERALSGARDGLIGIYARDGRGWRYPPRAEPNASLVDMRALADGSLLTLERAHGTFFLRAVISLRQVRLPATGLSDPLRPRTVAVFDTARGWAIDNFEGLAHHRGRRFFMVSDDNDRRLQRTLLVYFEVLPGNHDFEGEIPEHETGQQK